MTAETDAELWARIREGESRIRLGRARGEGPATLGEPAWKLHLPHDPVRRRSQVVEVIGYDDGTGSWICKNSWGTGWGEGGFFEIAYGQCNIDAAMWVVYGPADFSGIGQLWVTRDSGQHWAAVTL